MPYVDGFKIFISSDSKIGYIKSITDGFGKNVLGSTNLSSDSSWYVSYVLNLQADTLAKSSSYEIRFEEVGQVAFTWGWLARLRNIMFRLKFGTQRQTCKSIVKYAILIIIVNGMKENLFTSSINRIKIPQLVR